jgi:signal transduction histidine kinase
LRKGIDNGPEFYLIDSQGQYISAVYNNLEELTELLVVYFRQGIERGEYCLLIPPDETVGKKVENELKKVKVNAKDYFVSLKPETTGNQLLLVNRTSFDPGLEEFIEEGYKKAFSGEFKGLRTNFNFRNSEVSLKHYQEIVRIITEKNPSINQKNLSSLCTFPLNNLSGNELLKLIDGGNFYVKRKGIWERLRNYDEKEETDVTFFGTKRDTESTNRVKNKFIMNMSHELRTPLNSVIGFSDLLLEGAFGPLNTRQSKYVNNILVSGKNLLEIINNLVDISKLENGDRTLNYEDIDISSLIEDVRKSLLSLASGKKIAIELKIEPDIGNIQADRTKIRQILYNLISNAIKFTPEKGKVTIKAYKKEGMLEINILDNGIGLSKEDRERIFIPFLNADTFPTMRYNGAGLGLYIVKNFTDMHGGKIKVDSETGKGSTFTITLPIK